MSGQTLDMTLPVPLSPPPRSRKTLTKFSSLNFFFFSQILAKKGPLGSVWIAAHHDKRLKRSQVFETQISNTIDSIITPEVPLALRLSGQLMLGIVRIYAKKVGYLFQDCSDSFGRMKQGGKGQQQDNVNLPRDALQSSVQAITLPEIEQDPDFTQDPEAVGLGGGLSLPGTPISLAGSLAGTPEVLRRASVGSDGLRKSLSFESPAQSPYNSVDVDMMYTDEQFCDQGLEFELEPERLRSEDIAAATSTPATDDPGRTTLTPVQEDGGGAMALSGGGDLSPAVIEEVPDFVGFDEDEGGEGREGGYFSTPDVSAPRTKKQRTAAVILDVDEDGVKVITLENKYVRGRLKGGKDTLRNLERDLGKSLGRRGGAKRRKKSRRSSSSSGGAAQTRAEAFCEELLGAFEEPETEAEVAGAREPSADMADEDVAAFDEEALGQDFDPYADDQFDPAALPPLTPELAAEDEAAEASQSADEGEKEDDDDALEADEDGWSARTKQTLARVRSKLVPSSHGRSSAPRPGASCKFEEILPEPSSSGASAKPARRDAARCFFECLVLNSKGYINLEQTEAFGDLTITPRELAGEA